MKISRAWFLLALLAAATCAAQTPPPTTAPSTRSKFTIGKDTTLIDGPVNADGTINYVAAMNAIIGDGVTRENNAAPLLMTVKMGDPDPEDAKNAAVFEELHVPWPRERASAEFLEVFLAKRDHFASEVAAPEAEQKKIDDLAVACRSRPWKPEEHPEVADWLAQSGPAFAVVEKAVQLPRYFVPFVSDRKPPTAVDGLPLIGGAPLWARDALMTRAMMQAGEGKLDGALADLHALRKISRLLNQEHLEIGHLVANALEYDALRACAVLAGQIAPAAGPLASIRREISSLEPMPESDPITDRMEAMFALDQMMQCIRGDAQAALQLQTTLLDADPEDLDLGDFSRVDWNVALREAVRLDSLPALSAGEPYAQQIKEIDERAKQAALPEIGLFADDAAVPAEERGLSARQRAEKFLKKRAGETDEAYSRRIGGWLSGRDPGAEKGMLYVLERCRLMRAMALLTVDLAEYRAGHGAYPESLDALGRAVLQDPFSGKDILYRGAKEGFTLWSVGRNGTDDGGKGDDIVIHGGP